MTRRFVAALEGFVAEQRILLLQFGKGRRKDKVMAEHCGALRRDLARRSAMVNHYYIYAVDRDFGPFFLKFCSYFPFNANPSERARICQASAGIAFEALDNGILKCADIEFSVHSG